MIDLTYKLYNVRKKKGRHTQAKIIVRIKRKRKEWNDGVMTVRYVLINN